MSRASSPLLLSRNILLLKISAGQNTGSDRQVSRRKPERYAASELRMLYHRGEMPFAGFREGYAEELEASEGAAAFAERCRGWLKTQNVTLLYAAKNQQENHALVLAAWLRQKIG